MKHPQAYAEVQQAASRPSLMQRVWQSLVAHVAQWSKLHRQRVQLTTLSDDALKDIGLSRADIYQESERHFWQDPLKRH